MVVRAAQDQGAGQVHHQPDDRHGHGLLVVDGLRTDHALDRAEHHQRGNAKQEDSAGKARQHFDLPGAEGKAGIGGVAARGGIGEGAQTDGQRVRAHVPAIGQQRHRVEPQAGGDLHEHRDGGNHHHEPRAALGGLVAGIEDVGMGPR